MRRRSKVPPCPDHTGEVSLSTPELRQELSHTMWYLNRVASVRPLKKLLEADEVFGEYELWPPWATAGEAMTSRRRRPSTGEVRYCRA